MLACALLVACTDASSTLVTPAATFSADQVASVAGIRDDAKDPAVLALDVADEALCAATLIAPDVVLTARHCVAHAVEDVVCPAIDGGAPMIGAPLPASSLAVLSGSDVASASVVARGSQIVAPDGDTLCDADVALVVLDRPVSGITPLSVERTGIARGKGVRTVGFSSDGADARTLREHVPVVASDAHEFVVAEASCDAVYGGPAIDEDTGAVVGIAARREEGCDVSGATDVYTRADAFAALVDQALALAPSAQDGGWDAGKRAVSIATDFGGACETGADCASGVCVTAGDARYCSRSCSAIDHCPSGYACAASSGGGEFCAEK